MQTVFIVQGRGNGDNGYSNLNAFSTQTAAEQQIKILQLQDAADGIEIDYCIDPVRFNVSIQ
jgi:hypothetical protein